MQAHTQQVAEGWEQPPEPARLHLHSAHPIFSMILGLFPLQTSGIYILPQQRSLSGFTNHPLFFSLLFFSCFVFLSLFFKPSR